MSKPLIALFFFSLLYQLWCPVICLLLFIFCWLGMHSLCFRISYVFFNYFVWICTFSYRAQCLHACRSCFSLCSFTFSLFFLYSFFFLICYTHIDMRIELSILNYARKNNWINMIIWFVDFFYVISFKNNI